MANQQQQETEFYQQAVRFSQAFAKPQAEEFLQEVRERQAFEEAHRQHLQNLSQKRPLAGIFYLAMLVAGFISVGIYWQTGRFEQVHQGEIAQAEFKSQLQTEEKEDKNSRYLRNLQQKLREDANNGDLWFELGQAYALNNDFSAALICYQNAQKVLGEKPAILGAMATADYYDHHQQLSFEAKEWIGRALQLDPQESASLLLLASDAFLNNDYAKALNYWRKVLDSESQAINRPAIIESMRMARQMQQAKSIK